MSNFTALVAATFPGLTIGPHDSKTSVIRITVGHRDERGRVVGNEVVARLHAGETFEFVSAPGRVIELAEELIEEESLV
jgi:hypothetical protein